MHISESQIFDSYGGLQFRGSVAVTKYGVVVVSGGWGGGVVDCLVGLRRHHIF